MRRFDRWVWARGKWIYSGFYIGVGVHMIFGRVSSTTHFQGRESELKYHKVTVKVGRWYVALRMNYIGRVRVSHDVLTPRERQVAKQTGSEARVRKLQDKLQDV